MTAITDIYNLTLFYVGHTRRVDSPTEDTAERRNCEAVYEQRKRSLICMAKWSFAKTSVPLTLTGGSAKGWDFEYYYPQGCLKALEIERDNVRQKPIPFQTASVYDQISGAESRVIRTNYPNASLLFLRDVKDPTMFTPTFIETLAHWMGVPLSRVMSKNGKGPTEMFQLMQWNLQQAIMAGEAEALDEPEDDASWIEEAYGTESVDLNKYRKP